MSWIQCPCFMRYVFQEPDYQCMMYRRCPNCQRVYNNSDFKRLINLPNYSTLPSYTPDRTYTSTVIPGRAFFFILADEILPSKKLVRKVIQFPITNAEWLAAHPELFGIKPRNPNAIISIGEHALGNSQSPYTSASTLPKGAPNFSGRPVYIDIAKLKAAGAIIHSTEEILADLDRIAKNHPHMLEQIKKLKKVIAHTEKEVLIEGDIPASAVKSQSTMTVTRSLRVVQFIGFALTAYDLGNASIKSVKTESPKPLAAETIRQVGGWGGALAGAKIGGIAGTAVGIETGPGAIITGAVGALIFGAAGYFGADWVADFIEKN